MSAGLPGLRVETEDLDSANVVVYADGWGAEGDRGDLSATDVGADDFCEHLHLTTANPGDLALIDQLRAGLPAGMRYLVLRVTPRAVTLRLSPTGPDGR